MLCRNTFGKKLFQANLNHDKKVKNITAEKSSTSSFFSSLDSLKNATKQRYLLALPCHATSIRAELNNNDVNNSTYIWVYFYMFVMFALLFVCVCVCVCAQHSLQVSSRVSKEFFIFHHSFLPINNITSLILS